ncbi:DUF4118 domain-containing protein [Dactylosporangium sp. NPDC005572]|uniref:sensor histidine kinase n=1 Tax=Dactylosporangium sp. NPDC005572 TaxID=3156889 RepID=UPI0033BA7495
MGSLLSRPKPPPLRLGFLVAATFVAVETLVLFPFHSLAGKGANGVLYLVGVLVVAAVWGVWLGVATSLVSAVVFNYFHVAPLGRLNPSAGRELQDVAVFITAAFLVSALADVGRKHAVQEAERRLEADLSAELARLMLGASDLRSALDATSKRMAAVLDLPAAAIELDAVAGDERRTAIPLRDGATVIGTLLVPAGLHPHMLVRLRGRVAPALESLLRVAYERETITNSLKASRERATTLAAEQAALRRVATLVAHGAAPSQVFDVVSEELGRVLGSYPTALYRYESDGTATQVAGRNVLVIEHTLPVEGDSLLVMVQRDGRAARMHSYDNAVGPNAELARRQGIRSGVGVPIVVEDRLWGVAVVVTTEPEPLPANAEARMAGFTELVGTAIANADSHTQLTASRARIVAAGDDARRRIERDLHDGTQQRIIALSLKLRLIEASLPAGLDPVRRDLSQTVDDVTCVFEELREISRGIHPAILAKGGLGAAVKSLARHSAVPVDLTLAIDRPLPEPIEVGMYYVVSEALANAAKHAQATLVRVAVEADATSLRISIRDDGVGGANTSRGSGLIGLKDRVETLNGRMDVASPPGQGTALLVCIPIDGPWTAAVEDRNCQGQRRSAAQRDA